MNDKTTEKLIKLLHDGFLREFLGKEKTLKHMRAEARLRGFNGISKLKKAQLKKLFSKPQDLEQLRKRNLLVQAKAYARGVGVKHPLSLIFYKVFITCAKEIKCFRILFVSFSTLQIPRNKFACKFQGTL